MSEESQLRRIAEILEKLYKLLLNEVEHEVQPKNLLVTWFIKGEVQMSTSPIALNFDSTAKAVGVVTELNNDGSVFAFDPSKIQAVAQDTSVLTVTVDPATGNVNVVPLKVGSTNVAVGDSATGISAPVYAFVVSAVGPTPSSLSVSWTVTA